MSNPAAAFAQKARAKLGLVAPAPNPVTSVLAAPVATSLAAAVAAGEAQGKDNAKATKEHGEKITHDALNSVRLILDQQGVTRVAHDAEAFILDSDRGMDHMRMSVFNATGKAIGNEMLMREVSVLRARTVAKNERTPVYKRIAPNGDGTVIDMGGKRGIYVTPGAWEEREHDALLFIRGPGYGPLPSPVRAASPKAALAALDAVFAKMGVPAVRRLMLAVALVNALRHGVPYVIILLLGGAGSGKTTTAGNLGGCIDPTTSGELPNVPLNAQDIAAVAQEAHAVGLDNKSKIDPAASDLLCMGTHGSEFIVREFNTRKETTRMHVHCQFFITAITNPVTRGDLLDRVLPITLEPHSDYKGEDEVRAWFREVQPVALGALVELLAAALELLPGVKQQRRWKHRLVDFCQLGEAIAQACGDEPGAFVQQFDALRRETAEEAASGDPIIQHVLDVVREIAAKAEASSGFPPWRKWNAAGHVGIRDGDIVRVAIKASTLRDRVKLKALIANSRGWVPESDKAMADVLLQKKPTLAAIDISVARECFNGASGAAWVFSWSE